MIERFLKRLREQLDAFEMPEETKEEILADYEEMAEEALSSGKDEEEVLAMFKSPADIIENLARTHARKKKRGPGETFIALSTLLATIAFILLGFFFSLWHPGWLVFFLVPLSAIATKGGREEETHVLTAASPFLATIGFVLVGTFGDHWHPGWLFYFLIPVTAIGESFRGERPAHLFAGLAPFLSFTAFFLLAEGFAIYHPTWMVLLFIPLSAFFLEESLWKRGALVGALFISAGLYLLLGYAFDDWRLALTAFLVVVLAAVFTGQATILFDGLKTKRERLALALSVVLFVLVGYLFEAWAVGWLFLLVVPVTSLLVQEEKKRSLTKLAPFVSITAFMLVGHFTGYWHPAWLVFLLVPLAAVVDSA